jgi:pyruvate,orthophosphate dikinase
VLTLRGGVTSHAAVVMRSLGKPAVVGAFGLHVDWEAQTLTCASRPQLTVRRGEVLTVDGSEGVVYVGALPTVSTGQDVNFMTVMQWADKYKRMDVLANADTPEDIAVAQRMGAEGIGLCRTERMFSHPDRINIFRRMILADSPFERATWLLQLQPLFEQDFLDIFRVIGDRPIVIRLLDPPLHEFLPNPKNPSFEEEIRSLAQHLEMDCEECLRRVMDLQESNPMLGFRGCRLSIVYPEITEMQTKAIVGKGRCFSNKVCRSCH